MNISDVNRPFERSKVMAKGNGVDISRKASSSSTVEPAKSEVSTDDVEKLLKDTGIKPTSEIKQAIKELSESGYSLSPDQVKELDAILQKSQGTPQQKIDTLSAMAEKRIHLTMKSFDAVFQALFGPSLDKLVGQWQSEVAGTKGNMETSLNKQQSPQEKLSRQIEYLLFTIKNNPKISGDSFKKVIHEINQTIQSPELDAETKKLTHQLVKLMETSGLLTGNKQEGVAQIQYVKKVLETLLTSSSSVKPQSINQPIQNLIPFLDKMSNTNMEAMQAMQANIKEPIQALKTQIMDLPEDHPIAKILFPTLERLEKLFSESKEQETDHIAIGDQDLQLNSEEPLKELEKIIDQIKPNLQATESNVVQAVSFIRVTEKIPEHLREVGNQFKVMKEQVIKNVERMAQFLQQKIPQAASYVQRVIEPTIEMVNRLVSKSEFALFADTEFERDVLKISGDLQQVKGLLENDKKDEALKIFQGLKKDLDKLNWQPSYTKVESFFSKKSLPGIMINPLEHFTQDWRSESLSGRGVQEYLRDLGFSHERDMLDLLTKRDTKEQPLGSSFQHSQQQPSEEQDPPPFTKNMKAMLIQGVDADGASRGKPSAEQALANINGQQLLSKPNTDSSTQTMYFQLPLPWETGTQSVQMHLKSRSNGEKMDWENCQLYFYLDTPRFGETGIAVQVMNRELSLRVQNDREGLEKQFIPYVPQMEEQLQALGYKIQMVKFEKLSRQDVVEEPVRGNGQETAPKTIQSTNGKKGLDFTI